MCIYLTNSDQLPPNETSIGPIGPGIVFPQPGFTGGSFGSSVETSAQQLKLPGHLLKAPYRRGSLGRTSSWFQDAISVLTRADSILG